MHIKITTLAENTAGGMGILAEWGVSMLVEVDDYCFLLDTGAGFVAAHNSIRMNVDLKAIDKLIFSHGHDDHTGGLLNLLKIRKTPLEIIAHPDVWDLKYWKRGRDASFNFIGIPYSREKAESLGARFNLTPAPVWLNDNIVASGEVPMENSFESIDESAVVKTSNGFKPDPLRDDQSVFIKTDQGVVVICGCAHRGVVNTIRHAQKLTGCNKVYSVIGGIHLFSASEKRIGETIKEFRARDIAKIGVSHCTGPYAASIFAHEFKDKFFFNHAGTITEFEL